MKYHPACLVALYNKQIAVKKKTEEQTEIDIDAEHEVGDVALAELVNYIFQTQRNRYGATALRLSDLENTFERRVQQLKEIQSSVSPSLLELLCITEHGPDIQSQLENGVYDADNIFIYELFESSVEGAADGATLLKPLQS
ncbi:unnamed protein product [Mytilus coruscus]|uniref:Uncharacterized protein n=1 Tax=Mytilus coruscus TaxID=42192 RepID=A0A6J8A3L1_MYTCO|nr:unnamed protein product [Mytilus coruscus]